MKGDKTRIWRGGLAEIMGAKHRPSLVGDDKSEPASGAAHEASARTSGPQTTHTSRELTSGRTLVGHALDLSALQARPRSTNLSSTRVVPIEDLLREASPSEPEPPWDYTFLSRKLFQLSSKRERPASAAGARKVRLGVAQVRRGLMVALGAFTVGVWLWGQNPAGPAAHAQRPTVPQLSQPAAQAGAQREEAKEQPKAHAQALASASAPTPRQRHAVDALASGDFVAARRIYAELASTADSPSVYAEAARILDARLKTNGL